MISIDLATFSARAEALHRIMREDERVCGRLEPHIESYELDPPSILVSFPALTWEKNVNGVINGGIVATMLDATMGTVSYALSGGFTPTINLNVNYLRPTPGDGTLMARATVEMAGRTVIYMRGELWDTRDPSRILATAQGVFRNLANA